MAKDRANDPKRVPSLNIGEPKSHVRVTSQSGYGDAVRHMKLDAFGQTDESRAAGEKGYNDRVGGSNFVDKIRGKTRVVKINSDPTAK